MKRVATVLLASVLSLALTFSPVLAYAAEIDFDNIDDTGASGYRVDAGYIVTTGDAQNTIMGNGTNYALNFTHAAAEAVVQGDVVVGEGITAEGSLELTGTADDSLTVISNLEPAIEVQDELEISGGLEVTATSSNVEVTLPGISAGTFTLTEGKVIATGSASHDGVPSRGIQARKIFNIGGALFSRAEFDRRFQSNMIILEGEAGYVRLSISKTLGGYTEEVATSMSPYELLVALGIMPADVDLTGLVTRGQFAQYLYRFVNGGIDDNAIEYADYETAFTDIKDTPNENYIKALESKGIIQAADDKKYNPQSSITGYEALRCLLIVLGFDANKEGFYEKNYESNIAVKGSNIGLLSGLQGVDFSKPISQEFLSQMLYNALFTPLVTYKDGEAVPLPPKAYNLYF